MSKKGKKQEKDINLSPTIKNKKAGFNYNIIEKIEAGIILEGTEVKSLRLGKATLDEAYCRLKGDEIIMLGSHIATYEYGNNFNHEPLRPRKLLVHKSEIRKIEVKLNQKGFTLVPTRIYFNKRGYAKVEIALAQGKSLADKRTKLKDKQINMDIKRAISKWR